MQRNVLPSNAKMAPANFAFLDEPGSNVFGRINADRETDALGRENHRRIYPNNFAARINQRTTRITRVERRVGLHNVVNQPACPGAKGPAQGTDHTGGHRALEPVRIANRDGYLAYPDGFGFA